MLPAKFRFILENCIEGYLATCVNNQPYISLMKITPLLERSELIISTRKNTRKYQNLQQNPAVACLFHYRAPELEQDQSLLVLGEAREIAGDQIEFYRNIHTRKHPGRQPFLFGPDVAILTIGIVSLILADAQDQVLSWPSGSSEVSAEALGSEKQKTEP